VDSDAQTIAHALTRGMGWGSLAFEPADERRRKAPAKRWKFPALAVEQLT